MLADDLKSQKERERIQHFTQDHLFNQKNINVVDQSVVKAICERQFTYSITPDGEREGDTDRVALVETLAVSPVLFLTVMDKKNSLEVFQTSHICLKQR